MKHLSETQLNEFLDNALSTQEQHLIEMHISVCADCRTKMESLRSLFKTLSSLPEETLHRDLAPLVSSRLPNQGVHLGWKLVLSVQAGIGLGLTILIAINLLPLINLSNIFAIFTLKFSPVEIPSIQFQLPSLDIQPSTTNLIFLVVSGLILFGVGNATLLRSKREIQK